MTRQSEPSCALALVFAVAVAAAILAALCEHRSAGVEPIEMRGE